MSVSPLCLHFLQSDQRRASGRQRFGDLEHNNIRLLLKAPFADLVLARMVAETQWNRILVARLDAHAAIGSGPHMRSLDGTVLATRD